MLPFTTTPGRRALRWFLAFVLCAGILLCFGVYEVFYGANEFPGAASRTIFVSRGESYRALTDSLVFHGIIRNKTFFEIVARVHGGTDRIQVGKYAFASGVSNDDVYLTLRSGRGNQIISVTIPEGVRARVQAHILARHVGIDSARYMQFVEDMDFVHHLGIDAPSLEGYLMPDTYGLNWEQDEKDILKQQVAEFRKFFTDSLVERGKELGWTVHQVMTMASIVEGEAVRDDERSIISGVYHNRLRVGMRLEADPTIQYMLPDGPRRVLYGDLRLDSPFNTYVYAGLPPGPVNSPGRASILAALYPTPHAYLFFVATGRGGHWFARNYAEHQQFVRKYRRERARQWQAAKGTPRDE